MDKFSANIDQSDPHPPHHPYHAFESTTNYTTKLSQIAQILTSRKTGLKVSFISLRALICASLPAYTSFSEIFSDLPLSLDTKQFH